MQTSTLPELIRRESIPVNHRIFNFRRVEGKGIIEFDLPLTKEARPPSSADEALERLQALQVDLDRRTDAVKVIRAQRRE